MTLAQEIRVIADQVEMLPDPEGASTANKVRVLADEVQQREEYVAPEAPVDTSVEQWLTWDGGDGPSVSHWSTHLLLPWKNKTVGDWTDANGVKQGSVPFATFQCPTVNAWVDIDVTELVKKQVANGNKGFMLRSTRGDGPSFIGRTGVNKPILVVDGMNKAALCNANFSSSSTRASDTRAVFKVQSATPAIIQFDLKGLVSVTKATMRLFVSKIWGAAPTVQVYELDPPNIMVGAGLSVPTQGIAFTVDNEALLKEHPSVLRAGDFSDIKDTAVGGTVFDSISIGTDINSQPLVTQLPDPEYAGSVMMRGKFEAGGVLDGDRRGSCSFKTEHMRADQTIDPMCGPLVVETEMFCRLYFFLEDDWNSIRDSNKMAMGWDLRMGWWNPAQRGYWQSITGNGGAKGDGRKRVVPRKSTAIVSPTQNEYWGHAIRMEAGKASSTGNPYNHLRPIQSYAYHIDQATSYGDMLRLGNVCISKGKWFCIEQQVKMNSLTGTADSLGNMEAVSDGVLRTWLDGVLVDEHTNLRWRRHPDMGIQGPWINWYYGGKQPSEMDMHYRMNHFVVSREYIGPRKQV